MNKLEQEIKTYPQKVKSEVAALAQLSKGFTIIEKN